MKEHVQDYGVRKWAGDDLIELQSEPLSALQALVAPYAPCILTGCELETIPDGNGDYRLHAGYVALKGRKTVDNGAGTDTDTGAEGTGDGAETAAATADNGETTAAEEYVKIVRVTAQTVHQPTIFLTLGCTPVSRAYGNGENKAIAYDYTAEVCDVLSKVGDRPYLELVADAGNPRLPDKLGITQKLDRDGEAKDVVVGFTAAADRTELTTGSNLGVLFGLVKKWFSDLRALAFKDKVAKTDLDADLQGELDGKVKAKDGWGLSENDFSNKWMEKLDGIDDNANNYTHPSHTAISTITSNMAPSFGGTVSTYMYSVDDKGHVTGRTQRNVTIPSTRASASTAGLVIVDSTLSSSSTNPVQNKVVSTALAGKSDSGHVHSWDSVTGKPSTFTPSTHTHTWGEITGKPSIPKMPKTGFCDAINGDGNFERTATGVYKIYGAGKYVVTNVVGDAIARVYTVGSYTYVKITNTSGGASDYSFRYMILEA